MKSFSQRKGLKPVKTIVQVDSMDDDLRNALWNALTIFYWNQFPDYIPKDSTVAQFARTLWMGYFKRTLDTMPAWRSDLLPIFRSHFFACPWNEVYDFMEFVIASFPYGSPNAQFREVCNRFLEAEVSAYRFAGDSIMETTSKEEIAEIEGALDGAADPVVLHLGQALSLLTNRKSPDYRNSIKESISAVEAACKLATRRKNATLPDAIRELERGGQLHPALKAAFDKLYAYTSDAEGIRHALLEESTLDFADAKFMLVSCSAFVNYLRTKASKASASSA